jgi:hypothetical protein
VVNNGANPLSTAVEQCGALIGEQILNSLADSGGFFRRSRHFRAKTRPTGRVFVINYGVSLHQYFPEPGRLSEVEAADFGTNWASRLRSTRLVYGKGLPKHRFMLVFQRTMIGR